MRVFSGARAAGFLLADTVIVLGEPDRLCDRITEVVRGADSEPLVLTPEDIRLRGLDPMAADSSALVVTAGGGGRGWNLHRHLVGAAVEALTHGSAHRLLVCVADDVGDRISAGQRARRLAREIGYEAAMNGVPISADTDYLSVPGHAGEMEEMALSAVAAWCTAGRRVVGSEESLRAGRLGEPAPSAPRGRH